MGWLGNLWDDITGNTAAKTAAAATTAANQASIAEQRQYFNIMQEQLSPYTEAGSAALQQQMALSGALGTEAQAAAYSGIQGSEAFQNALAAGETSILQNAAATGGLRGGNTQAALAQYAPSLLNDYVQNQYANLGSLSQLGQASAAAVGTGALSTGSSISDALTSSGNTQAQLAMAQYQNSANTVGNLLNFGVGLAGLF